MPFAVVGVFNRLMISWPCFERFGVLFLDNRILWDLVCRRGWRELNYITILAATGTDRHSFSGWCG